MAQSRLISAGTLLRSQTGAGPTPAKSRFARDLRIWTVRGQLRDEIVRDIADRLRAGQSYDDISTAIGIRKATGRRKCAEIATAINLPLERSRYEIDTEEVLRRVELGNNDREIAAALDRSADSVSAIRRKHGIHHFTQLRISDAENAEIECRLLGGESTRAVAAAVGCEQADLQRRLRHVAHLIPKNLPPCACGKPCNHGGRCDLIVDPQVIRDRLLAGKTSADIAREFNRSAQNFKPKYAQPVIDQLTAEGHLCGCGQPFGHQFVCAVTMAVQRRTFTEAERTRATQLIREGQSVAKVKADLAITTNSAKILVREVRTALAADGVCCPCGEPIDHSHTCIARNGAAQKRTAFRFTCAAAASMPVQSRRKVSKLAREGWPNSVIVKRTGESIWRVTQMIEDLDRAGQLPAKCAGCDLPRGHKAPCPMPELCKCGRPRNHRGPCRRADGRKRVPFTKLTNEQLAMVKRRYRDRQSIRGISRATGIPFSVVQRQVARWKKASKYEPTPCPCGRPLRHGGSCWATRNGVVGRRHLTRIEQGILAGRTTHAMAEQLKLSVMTILKHSVPIRDRLFAEGVTCECGRALNHNFWCSARWDAHDMPRGRRPFPEPQETQAIEALLRGDLVADIASAIGTGIQSVWRLRRMLSDDQRAQRARAMRERLAHGRGSQGEALMTRIRSAVSSRLDPVLRDDVVSEIYLAVIEGRVEVEQIGAVARSFINRGLREWQPMYGPASLDEAAGPDDTRTRGDRIADTTTMSLIDDMQLGGDA